MVPILKQINPVHTIPSYYYGKLQAKKTIWSRYQACCLLHAGFLLGLLYYPEYGADMFL
jgi:hypothetical protein